LWGMKSIKIWEHSI